MASRLFDPDYWRERAEEARARAEQMTNSDAKKTLLTAATFDLAAVGIAHVAPNGRFLRVNQKLCDIFGLKRDELLQRCFQELTYPHDLAADLSLLSATTARSSGPTSLSLLCGTKPDVHRIASASSSILPSANGRKRLCARN
jgi:PAS domain S-box-containing protein